MKRRVVCISHNTGAGGSEIGRLVAQRLGFRYVDEDLVAHAASHAISARSDALRVFVTASPQTRITRLCDVDRLEEPSAARAIKEADAARADYLKRFHEVDAEEPTQYDIVLNTDQLSIEEAAELVSAAASTAV